MLWRKGISLFLASAIVLCAAGCASREEAARSGSEPDPLKQALQDVALSSDLTVTTVLGECDPDSAAKALEQKFDPTPERAGDLWAVCEAQYACSPVTARMVRRWAATGEGFQLGFADLKRTGVQGVAGKVGGLSVAKTRNVYLDPDLETPRRACHVLLHELVHRFDPEFQRSGASLAAEYRAYWHQVAFVDELYLRGDHLGAAIRRFFDERSLLGVSHFHTRESLLESVAKVYHFDLDRSIAEHYPKLPREVAAGILRAP